MKTPFFAPRARLDIAEILDWTLCEFGPKAARRYSLLLETALADLAENPERLGVVRRPEISKECGTYHLFHSRKKAARAGRKVRDPRHFLVFRVSTDETLEIVRVLHDAMDLGEHLPSDLRS